MMRTFSEMDFNVFDNLSLDFAIFVRECRFRILICIEFFYSCYLCQRNMEKEMLPHKMTEKTVILKNVDFAVFDIRPYYVR